MIIIKSVNVSSEKGTPKTPVPSVFLTENGIEGDAHSGPWNRQVSLLGVESIRRFEAESHRKTGYGAFAENITTEGIDLWKCRPLDRFTSGDTELEVTQIGKDCHGHACSIFKEVGNCVMPKEGIFARVIRPGMLQPQSEFTHCPKVYTAHVVTLSDRAFAGHYEDLSGPAVLEHLKTFFTSQDLPVSTRYSLLPDNPVELSVLLSEARERKTDIVITTGGTGIGPKDCTPEVVAPLLDKEIPGIMDHIRTKYGSEKPNALLSRSIAGVMGTTLVFTLPGSVRAVNEYMTEILKSMMHMIYMLHGLDTH